jgi:hypothetical protein
VPSGRVEEIGLLLEDKDFHQQIKKGQKDSTGKDERKGDRKSVEEIGLLLEDKDFHQQIKKGQKDSTGKDARFVLKKVLPFLNFGGRKSEYGAIQLHFITVKIYELSQRYGSGSTYLTMSLDEKNNSSAFRMTFRPRTLKNETFPARLKKMEESNGALSPEREPAQRSVMCSAWQAHNFALACKHQHIITQLTFHHGQVRLTSEANPQEAYQQS